MKKLSDFAEDINKCSRCGKCQEVCPIYKLTGNDCAVSRGKFVMLKGILNGDLKLSKTINKYLDMCLKCGKCKDFCPSDIDICQIFNTAKSEYVKGSFYNKFTKLLQSVKLKSTKSSKLKGTAKLLYFDGCVNKVYPKAKRAMLKVLSHYDVELIEKDFDCCGMPFLSSGNLERFEQAKQHNLELLKGNYDYIITDCASCESTLKDVIASEASQSQYNGITTDTSCPRNDNKIVNICHFLAIQDKKFIFNKPLKVTFHKPCHLKDDSFLKPLFAKCQNVEYIKAKDYDECCGFAGEFALRNPKISFKMTRKKAQNLAATGADIILTACPACIIGIHQGFLGKKHPKIMNVIEFLALADEIL